MSKQIIMCVVKTPLQVINIINELRDTGFPYYDISILLPDRSGKKDFVYRDRPSADNESEAWGNVPSEIIEESLGWVIGVRNFWLPGVGHFMAVGPIVDLLADVDLGANNQRFARALVDLGLSDYDAEQFEGKLKQGGVLITAHTEYAWDRVRIKAIFKKAQACDIATICEAASIF